MADKMMGQKFTWVNVGEWVEQGLIAPDQAEAIRQYAETRSALAERPRGGRKQPRGLNLVTIAYYFGGFMILLAYVVFLGLQWGSLTYTAQSMILVCTIYVLWATGYLVRRAGFQTAGGLLIFVGTAIVPLLVYAVLQALSIGTDSQPYYSDRSLEREALVAMTIAGVSLITATLVLLRIRFPLLMLLAAFWSYYLVMSAASWFIHRSLWSWRDDVLIAGSLLALALIDLGIYIQSRQRQRYSLWLYIVGHFILLIHLSSVLLGKGVVWGLLFLSIYITCVVASVWLQQRVFLVFGVIGCYTYIGYLAFDVFAGSLGFAFALAAVGFLIILTTVGYQKYGRPWLAGRFARHYQSRRLDA